MNEFTRRTRDKHTKERVQSLYGISYLCKYRVRAARTEWKLRVKSRGLYVP